MAKIFKPLAIAALAAGVVSFSHANLTIGVTFGANLQADPNHVAIENAINADVAYYQSLISNTFTANIKFDEMSSGLGQSLSWIYNGVKYSDYRNALVTHATSAADTTALVHLSAGPNNPVNNSTTMTVNENLMVALGLAGYTGDVDEIDVNTSICNIPGQAYSASKYSLKAVVAHEIDETLGFGSGVGGRAIEPEDLFRYKSATSGGALTGRSFTTGTGVNAWFSIDGSTKLTGFNQSGGGADYGDWASSSSPQVQDAFGTPGANPQILGPNEVTALDVIGYQLNRQAVPEPISMTLLGLGAFALLRKRRS